MPAATARRPRPLPGSSAAIAEETPIPGLSVTVRGATGDPYWRDIYRDVLKADLCLFAKEVLKIEVGPHMVAWGNLVSRGKRIAINAARDHSKSTFFSYAYPIWRAWSEPGCEVYLFSNTMEQAQEFLDIIVYGRNNLAGMVDIPELSALVPDDDTLHRDPRARLNRSDVRLLNGSRLRAVGYGKAIRGRHPKYIVLDDPLNDEDMWSETTRRKNIEYYKSAITHMLPPDGQLIVVGTPYHAADLYGWLRQNKYYAFRRFPGIVKDKRTGEEKALFPWRWPIDQLKARREEVGPVTFAREVMCEPITDDMSIFPGFLFPPLFDPVLKMRPTRAEIEARGWETFMGVDIARSANVGADRFVIFVQAKDAAGQRTLIDIRASRGLEFRQQLEQIAVVAQLYEPGLIYIESNAMQQVYTDEMRRLTDLPVKEFVTKATNKYPLDKGVPGLRIILENRKLTIPRGDALSVQLTDEWIAEATQFGFVDGKLQGIGEHDDIVMAWWFAEEAARAGGFSFAFGEEDKEASSEWAEEPEVGGDPKETWEDVMLGGKEEREEGDAAFGT